MSDETNMRQMPEVPRGLRDALEAGRADVGTDREVDLLAAAVLARIGGGGGGGGGGSAAAAKGATMTGSAQLAVAAAVLLASGIAVWSTSSGPDEAVTRDVLERELRERAAEAAAEAESGTEPGAGAGTGAGAGAGAEAGAEPGAEAEAEAESGAGTGVSAPVARRRLAPAPVEPEPVVAATPPAAVPVVVDELALLREARRVLSADPARSLALVDEMGGVPAPAFAEERERVAIEALHRLDRTPEARARLERFVAAHPRSAYRARLEEMLGAPP